MKDVLESIQGIRNIQPLRLTYQRKVIIRLLHKNQHKHLSVADIYGLLRQQGEKLGIATVYRNLIKLESLGIVNKIALANGKAKYEFNSSLSLFHYHLICSRCGDIVQIEAPALLSSIYLKTKDYDFQIDKVKIVVSGYCSSCQKFLGKECKYQVSEEAACTD